MTSNNDLTTLTECECIGKSNKPPFAVGFETGKKNIAVCVCFLCCKNQYVEIIWNSGAHSKA